jgi:hypothetical protein
MKTIRDHIAAHPAIPAPPPGASHVLVWEPYGRARTQWALSALDAPPDGAEILVGSADANNEELTACTAAELGYPVVLSVRIDVDGEIAFYVTPA